MKEKLIGNFTGIVLNVAVEVMVTLHCESTSHSHRWWNLPLDNRTMQSWTLDHWWESNIDSCTWLVHWLASLPFIWKVTGSIPGTDQHRDHAEELWAKVQDCMVRLSNGRFHHLCLVLSLCRVAITSTATLSTMPAQSCFEYLHFLAIYKRRLSDWTNKLWPKQKILPPPNPPIRSLAQTDFPPLE